MPSGGVTIDDNQGTMTMMVFVPKKVDAAII
jgi:hypothetical protein